MTGAPSPTDGSLYVRRRGCLLWLSAGALGWLACATPVDGGAPGGEARLPDRNDPDPDPAFGTGAAQTPSLGAPKAESDAAAPDAAPDAAPASYVTLYDTYAVALYFDGSIGPTTGIIHVADVAAGKTLTLDFWHGHGGMLHRFTVMPQHFAELKKLHEIMLETTMVEGHSHKLFVDPVSATWRVPGAQPVSIPA